METTQTEKTQTQTQTQTMFTITEEGKKHIGELLQTKPYVQVFTMVGLLNKEKITESDANTILNYLGNLQYKEVQTFFQKANEYFIQLSPEAADLAEPTENSEQTQS